MTRFHQAATREISAWTAALGIQQLLAMSRLPPQDDAGTGEASAHGRPGGTPAPRPRRRAVRRAWSEQLAAASHPDFGGRRWRARRLTSMGTPAKGVTFPGPGRRRSRSDAPRRLAIAGGNAEALKTKLAAGRQRASSPALRLRSALARVHSPSNFAVDQDRLDGGQGAALASARSPASRQLAAGSRARHRSGRHPTDRWHVGYSPPDDPDISVMKMSACLDEFRRGPCVQATSDS